MGCGTNKKAEVTRFFWFDGTNILSLLFPYQQEIYRINFPVYLNKTWTYINSFLEQAKLNWISDWLILYKSDVNSEISKLDLLEIQR